MHCQNCFLFRSLFTFLFVCVVFFNDNQLKKKYITKTSTTTKKKNLNKNKTSTTTTTTSAGPYHIVCLLTDCMKPSLPFCCFSCVFVWISTKTNETVHGFTSWIKMNTTYHPSKHQPKTYAILNFIINIPMYHIYTILIIRYVCA